MSQTTAVVGAASFPLTVTGQNFLSTSVVAWNGAPLVTTFISPTQLTATILNSLLAATGTFAVTVLNQAPNASSSIPFMFTVTPVPLPTIGSVSPTSVIAGATAFTLQVSGSAFVSGSTIQLNGSAVPTTYIAATNLSATVPDSAVAAAGTIAVTILSPGTGFGPITSNSVNLIVNPLPAGDLIVNQVANDIVWDPQHKLIYASVPGSATQNANDIVAIDPATGLISKSVFAGSEPDLLAISDDGQFLYAALDGSSTVQRFILPAMTRDVSVSLGGSTFYGFNTAIALDVAPGVPNTWMVSVGDPQGTPEAIQGVTVYDGAVARPTSAGRYTPHGGFDLLLDSAVWGKNASVIYGANDYATGFDFYVLPVTAAGVPGTTIVDDPGIVGQWEGRIHFDKTTGLIYADNAQVLNPANGTQAGSFFTGGGVTAMVPDGSIGKAFIIYQANGSSPLGTITSFDINHFTPINSMPFPNVASSIVRLIRWGTNGLAFNAYNSSYNGTTTTKTGKIYILSGTFVQ